MKKYIVKAVWIATAFILLIALLWGFLALTSLIPNESIKENMMESALSYKDKEAFDIPENGRLRGISDNFADAILLSVAYNMGEYGALDTKYYSGEEYGENAGFYLTLIDETVAPDTDYTRYWHGNAGIARLMHTFTDVEGMKTAAMIKIYALAGAVFIILLMRKRIRTGISFALSLIFIGIWNVGLSLEYQPAFIIALFMSLLFLTFEKKSDFTFVILSVIGGVLTAFFDFLTCETLPVLLPLGLLIASRIEDGEGKSLRENLKLCGICIVAFGAAYLGTFLAKWTLATIFTGENKFFLAAESAGVRMGGASSGGFLSGIPANLTVLFGGSERIDVSLVIIGVLLSAAVLFSAFYILKKKKYDKDGCITLLILGSIVLLRFALLQNHSYLHEFFTYRALMSTVFCVFSATLLSGRKLR